jgi:NitT/TauT family transport system permease protein
MKTSTIKKAALIGLFWIVVWQIISIAVGKELIVPSPYSAFKSFSELLISASFYRDAFATIFRCVVGMSLSFVFGLVTALLSYRFSIVRSLLSLPVLIFKATPVMAVILFLLIVLTSANVPIFVCFLMCYPIVYTNLLSGFDNIERQHIELAKFYHLGTKDMISFVFLPSVMPQISASLNLIAGLSWKTVVAAEVLASPRFSMGYNLFISKVYLETANLFAWIISIICFSLLFEKIIKQILKQFTAKPYAKSKVLKRMNSGYAPTKQASGQGRAPEIEVSDLSKSFNEKVVFSGFSECFPGGKTTAIMAPSGYGKTTLFRMIAGLEKQDEGKISGVENVNISYLFQESRLLPWLNIFDNIALFLKNKMPAGEIESQVTKMLDALELSSNMHNLPYQLSGGMKHRVAVGRAFLCPASVLLLDEPFKGLDAELKKRIISNLWANYTDNKTILLVTHNQEDADHLSNKQIIL